jgi:uncharacterized protein with HEPN domain
MQDMLDAIEAIRRHTGSGRQTFDDNELVKVWVLHHLQIIGEAAARLDSDGDPAQRLPLRGIIGMRNVLVHGYFQVDDDLVWAVVEKELDPLAAHLKELLSS